MTTQQPNDGGQAFPLAIDLGDRVESESGMSLRDYFAAKALPAAYKDTTESARIDGWPENWRQLVAEEAYAMADAMLKARGL